MFLEAVKISLIAYMFVYLGQPGMFFSWYQNLIYRIKWDWLYKPLGGCEKCFAGQSAFWYYIFFWDGEYRFFEHLFFVSVTIALVMIYRKITDYIDHEETENNRLH